MVGFLLLCMRELQPENRMSMIKCRSAITRNQRLTFFRGNIVFLGLLEKNPDVVCMWGHRKDYGGN